MIHGAGNPVADWIQNENHLDELQTRWDSGQGLSTEEVEELIWKDVRNSLDWTNPIGSDEVKYWNGIYRPQYFGQDWENVGSDDYRMIGIGFNSENQPEPDEQEPEPITIWSRLKRLFWR